MYACGHIADNCHWQLTVRCYDDGVRKQLIDAIKRKAKAAAMSVGAKEPEVTVSEGTPSLSNDAALAGRMREIFPSAIGKENVSEQEPVMGGEDFSHFGRNGVPSLMYFLGTVEQRRLDRYKELGISAPSLHSAEYYPEIEKSIEIGVTTMASGALELLQAK